MAILTGNIYIDAIAVVVSIVAVIVASFKWWFSYWQLQGVYTPKPIIPFGNAKEFLFQNINMGVAVKDAYNEIKSKGERFGGYYFLGNPIFIPVDLDLVKSILTKDFMHFTNHLNTCDEKTDLLSTHIFNLKDARWKNLRMKLTPTFTSGKMKMMFQTLVNCSDYLVKVIDEYIEQEQAIDIKEVVARFTTDVIGSCAFGIECNTLKNPNSDFRKYGKKIFGLTTWGGLVRQIAVGWPNLLVYLKIRTFRKDISDFFTNIVKETVDYREKNNIIRKDFMHLLIQLKNNVKITENSIGKLKNESQSDEGINSNESAFTMNDLIPQAFVFFAAGFETSSTTTTFCLYELVQNPEIQEKLREEVNTVLKKYDGELTYDAVMDMTYMEKCINETLRKHPPVAIHTRECTETYKVPGTNLILKKGSSVFVPVLGIHSDPEYYSDPDKFDPERFSVESKAKRHGAAWIPFGDGPRACIGLRFGIMQTKVGLTALLKHFRFTLHPKTTVPLDLDPRSFVLSVREGVWLTAERI